ncbi:BglG family transcription antiterminator [Salinicoccus halitifaciens]|uniref:Mannitol operon transcriptional antiterminator n=1 Tax=Salinicoccus halitifaciens TaxID=1073415 RepID=A0ABV2E848_9STAP|nr:PRD domain-containing protein [Salinicoccus halitifaciens]MCD2137739.1 PRD domain-containing protein [Salinicoccus halitifaciens]
MISSREKKIITELIYHNGAFLLINEIASKLGVSSRTVHRELVNVRKTLDALNIPLESEYRRGIRIDITPLERDALTRYIAENSAKDLSAEEKQVALIYNLMLRPEGTKKSALAFELGSSEHALDELISDLNRELSPYDLSITKDRRAGVHLNGDTLNKQNFLTNMMVDELNSNSIYSVIENNFVFSSLINDKLLGVLEVDHIFKVERLLMDELVILPYQLTENAYLNLTLHIVLAIERTVNTQAVEISPAIKEELADTEEYEVSKALTLKIEEAFGITFPDEEVYFITMHLRGSKRKSQAEAGSGRTEAQTKKFIRKVGEKMDYPFHAYPELQEGLVLHIEPMLHRLESNIITANPLLEVIKDQYPALFRASGEAFREVFGIEKVDESEIGFLTIHFGGILKANPPVEITTVCSSGIGTSRILSNQLRTHFQNIHIKRELSISELADTQFGEDELVLSTVPLDIDNYILVTPLLDDYSVKKISEAIQESGTAGVYTAKKSRQQENKDIDIDKILQATELFHFKKHIELDEKMEAPAAAGAVLAEHSSIQDIEAIMSILNERYRMTGFIIGESGFSFPHVKSGSITKHEMLIVKNREGFIDKNYRGEQVTVEHQILLLVPEATKINELISDISVLLGEYHEDIASLIDSGKIEETIKDHIKYNYGKD